MAQATASVSTPRVRLPGLARARIHVTPRLCRRCSDPTSLLSSAKRFGSRLREFSKRNLRIDVRVAMNEESGSGEIDFGTPPYAKLSMPVYSLATASTFNGVTQSPATMNILTYATPIAIKPARRFVIALYRGTLSADNMLSKSTAVLQLLGEQHAGLLDLLGKQSGHEVDKIAALNELGFDVVERYGVPTIKDCLGVIQLRIVSLQDTGDHDLALCDVLNYDSFEDNGDPLYTGTLRSMGLL
mmetsp:Transcript_10492/g.19941  ORF Transcript_10492/g.19941 Transcript_10492/m.19941 type:complete len:243 (-) Transcript_10492:325-1053(-)